MTDRQFEIRDIKDLVKIIIEVNNRHGGQIWWRGHTDFSYRLQPSIFRPYYKDRGIKYEANINYRFQQKAPALRNNLPKQESFFEWLFLMQHYGLPTRLLDWTESPLIACFFAIENKSTEDDGALFALNPYKLNQCQGLPYRTLLPQNIEGIKIAEHAFSSTGDNAKKVAAILPGLIDQRMISQLSVFTIHDDDTAIEDMDSNVEFLDKFRIPFSVKELLREQLKFSGIRPSSIFPDLEHLAQEIKSIKNFKEIT